MRVRTCRSPADMRRATSVMRRSAPDSSCAAPLDMMIATTSAMASAASRRWRNFRIASATLASGTARRAAPRVPSGRLSGTAAYMSRSRTVTLQRIEDPGRPASALAISGRSWWFSRAARLSSGTSESPSTRPSAATKVTRPCARGPSASASASQVAGLWSCALLAACSTSDRRARRSARMRSVRLSSMAGRSDSSAAIMDAAMSPSETRKSLARMSSFTATSARGRRRVVGRTTREPVAHAAHRLEIDAGVAQLLAQALDVSVHRARVDLAAHAPDLVEQNGARLHAAAAIVERAEQAQLERREGDLFAVDPHPVPLAVDTQPPERREARALGGRAAPPQDRLQAQRELAHAVGLDDVVVGAELEADDPVDLLALGRQHDDGDLARRRIALERAADVRPRHVRQHEVQQHQIGRLGRDALEPRLPRPHDGGLVARLTKVVREHLLEIFFVLDDQDAGHGWRSLSTIPRRFAVSFETRGRYPLPRRGDVTGVQQRGAVNGAVLLRRDGCGIVTGCADVR